MKRFVIGDIHGNYEALVQVLQRSEFDCKHDLLITLGDIVDGWGHVYECVEELLKIKNRIDIRGNHDDWFNTWLTTSLHPQRWGQGGEGTLKSYADNVLAEPMYVYGKGGWGNDGWTTNLLPTDIPECHINFFKNQIKYYTDEDKTFFTHGGFDRHKHVEDQHSYVFMWDRDLFCSALSFGSMGQKTHLSTGKPYKFKMVDDFKRVFIGHTGTHNWEEQAESSKAGVIVTGIKKPITTPMRAANIINIDTGAGYKYPLTIMNVDTEEYFQSDGNHYPGEKGR